jgi:uncharacterized protein
MDKGLPAISITRPRPGGGAVSWAGHLPVEDEWVPGEVEFGNQPDAEIVATETASGGVHVTGKVSATLRIRCRRCLVQLTRGVESGVDIRFEPDMKLCDEAPGLYALDSRLEKLDLLPALREELYLALPSYPLCQPECRGLCAACGTDLNASTCECEFDTSDPRWEALRQMAEETSRTDDG